MTEERQSLYERDFYLWLEQQAARLREGRLDQLDVANLLEEVEDMGRSEKRAIEGNLVVLLTICSSIGSDPNTGRAVGPARSSSSAAGCASC